ncbi:MAG: hypothetical protein JXR37_08590 [Kiritimatiellae bacterium]|nr:hypothetical protein [Kiritimatiellia bacterium]
MILKLVVLIALIRLLIATDKPFLCSSLYAAVVLVSGLLFARPLTGLLICAGLAFLLASLYFWLLDRFQDGLLWWVILVGGLAVGLV